MRPPRHILLIDANEQQRSSLSFALWVKGYRVTAIAKPSEYCDPDIPFDLILAAPPFVFAAYHRLIAAARRELPVPVMLMSLHSRWDELFADTRVPSWIAMAELLDRVRAVTARKRGPRKGTKKLPVAVIVPAQPKVVLA